MSPIVVAALAVTLFGASTVGCGGPKPTTQALMLTANAPGNYAVQVSLRTGLGLTLPPVVLDVAVQP